MSDKSPEEKHAELLSKIAILNTKFDEVVRPAVKQVWLNENAIIGIQSFQKVIKYLGTTTVGATVFIVGKMIYGLISKHPPPPSIHP